MLLEESKIIGDILAQLELSKGALLFDIGSSTEQYRCLEQPYIDYYVFRPLRERGVTILYIDVKKEQGVDLVCDLAGLKAEETIKEIGAANVILCTSLLEHVEDRELVLRRIESLIKPGGVIVLTVPFVFPYHENPIDTMYRPSNIELEKLFNQELFTILASEIVEAKSFPVGFSIGCFMLSKSQNLFVRMFNKLLRTIALKAGKLTVIPSKVSVIAARKNI